MGYGLASAIGVMLLAIYAGAKGSWIWLLGIACYLYATHEKKPPQRKHVDYDRPRRLSPQRAPTDHE